MAKKLTPVEWVAEINARAAVARKVREDMGTTVRVLIRTVLNGPNHKALGWCNPGDIVDVASGVYARGLIEKGFVTTQLEPKAEAPEVTEAPEAAEAPPVPEVDATSSARKLAEELGIDLAEVEGTGSGGRIVKGDVGDFVQRAEVDKSVG